MMKKTLAVLSVLTLCSATSAFAMNHMKQMDTDHIKMMVGKHMKMIDTNGDGLISKEEHKLGAEKMFKDCDANGDNMVSKQEMINKKMKEMKDMGMMKKSIKDKQ
jgi:hypothetical protein